MGIPKRLTIWYVAFASMILRFTARLLNTIWGGGIAKIKYPKGNKSILTIFVPRRKYTRPKIVMIREKRFAKGSNAVYPISKMAIPNNKIKIPLKFGSTGVDLKTSLFLQFK
jgi:hypothetical protein